MLSFFPTPYPDEIFYSVLARYHIRSGNISPKATIRELFNSTTTTATVDLPANLDALLQNLPLFSKHTVESLAHGHTLYPFYAAFLLEDRAAQVLESMRSGQRGDIHNRTGIMASAVESPRYLRFCPLCLEADQQEYGEAYWHRLHQVPGVLVCPLHAVFLLDSTVSAQGANKHEYHAASPENCPLDLRPVVASEDTLHKLLVLAKDISWFITNNPQIHGLEWLRKKYTSLLIEKGLATPSGRLHQKDLLDNFLFFYGREFLQILGSMVSNDKQDNWLCSIVRKHRKAFHPLRHLLMIRFLDQSVENFFALNYEHQPFGSGPWYCLNAAAEHYLRPVITDLVLTYDYSTKKPVGTFSCGCGFVYSRTGPDVNENDRYRIGKMKAYGPVWQEKLRQLVQEQRSSLRETARQLGVDPITVKRYATLLGLESSWLKVKMGSREAQESRQQSQGENPDQMLCHQYREAWQSLQHQHHKASRTTLRSLAPAIYIWLYRHDREWLLTNSPATQRPLASVLRVDWEERDQEVLAQVKKAVQSLLLAKKPVRLTVSRIAKSVDLLSLLEKHQGKLPDTRQYLAAVVETLEQYQIRRIQWAARTLEEQGKEVKAWEIIQIARLRPGYSRLVETAIQEEVKTTRRATQRISS